VKRLLLDREDVVSLLPGLVAVEERRRERDRLEAILHRRQHIGEVLELAVEGPLAGGLHVISVGIGDVGHGARVERRHRLGVHVRDRVLRQLDLHAALPLVLLDRGIKRVVFGLVEALDPPHGELLLGKARGRGQGNRQSGRAGNDAGQYASHRFLVTLFDGGTDYQSHACDATRP
jgi:hypothetical protein